MYICKSIYIYMYICIYIVSINIPGNGFELGNGEVRVSEPVAQI